VGDDTMTIEQFRDRVRARVLGVHPDWLPEDVEDSHGPGLRFALPDDTTAQLYMHNTYRLYLTGVDADRAIDTLMKGLGNLAAGAAFTRYIGDFATAREHLMVQLSVQYDDDDLPEEHRRVFVPWQGGLVLYPVIDLPETLMPIGGKMLDRWQVTLDEVMAIATGRTRDRLAANPGGYTTLVPGPGLTLTIWDNDLPGYTATRAAWPDLALPVLPTGDGYGVVCAPDRDFCVSLLADNIETLDAVLAVAALVQIVKTRVRHPRPLMAPGVAFCRPDGTYEYQPIVAGRDDE
jgi:hypothetical protein